jgi:signal transduction histidine kinase
MPVRRRLRSRVAATFAVFGGLLSLIQAMAMYVASHNLEQRLIDETLTAELQDYAQRRLRNPRSLPEKTSTIRAYVISGQAKAEVPPSVAALAPGRHQLILDGMPFRVAVTDFGAERYAMLYNESQLEQREQRLLALLAAAVLGMSVLSAVAGFWLSGRVIAPVTDLVRRVAKLRPEDRPEPLADHYPWMEVHELAEDFDDYLARLSSFIERERAFTADVSHELRTPLAVLNGAAEVLLSDPGLPKDARGRVMRMARGIEEMTEITTALLVLAREEGAEGARGVASCDVEAVVQEVADKLRELHRAKPVILEVEVTARPRLAVERAVLTMVVSNLLRNAFAHTEQGRIRVCLDERTLEVADTGGGIDPAELSRVFERYYRSENSSGAGIGLSLVKRICDRYGWIISIDSQPGQGTVTRLEFGA